MPGNDLIKPLRDAPEQSALLFDVDGTLAPIAARPELAEVPPRVRAELQRLAGAYLLVACISGRAGADAHRLVGVEGVEFVGNHGLELLPEADSYAAEIGRFRETVGLPVEDKGLSLSYHFREAADHDEARSRLEEVAAAAREAGLDARWGRMVLEIRPLVQADKGTAVRTLLKRSAARRGLYAGDDSTDLDAFAGLVDARLDHAVCVAVDSAEGPEELRRAADLVVGNPGELLTLLGSL